MGLRGPAPEPTALKLLRGNPGKRPLNDTEPKPPAGKPKCPVHLDARAKKEWKRLVKILAQMKVMTEADYLALGNLCSAYALQLQLQHLLAKVGLLTKNKVTEIVRVSPLLEAVNQQIQIVDRQLQQFGLSPSSRVRLHTEESGAAPEDKWSRIGRHRVG